MKKAEKGRVVTQLECRAHLELLFENENEIVDILFGEKQLGEGMLALFSSLALHLINKHLDGKYLRRANLDTFFIEVVAVLPSRFRPVENKDGQLNFHRQNKAIETILNVCLFSKNEERRGTRIKKS